MSEQPIQLDTLHVQVQEVSLRKLPNGPDRMFAQTDGTGKVWWTSPMGPTSGAKP